MGSKETGRSRGDLPDSKTFWFSPSLGFLPKELAACGRFQGLEPIRFLPNASVGVCIVSICPYSIIHEISAFIQVTLSIPTWEEQLGRVARRAQREGLLGFQMDGWRAEQRGNPKAEPGRMGWRVISVQLTPSSPGGQGTTSKEGALERRPPATRTQKHTNTIASVFPSPGELSRPLSS